MRQQVETDAFADPDTPWTQAQAVRSRSEGGAVRTARRRRFYRTFAPATTAPGVPPQGPSTFALRASSSGVGRCLESAGARRGPTASREDEAASRIRTFHRPPERPAVLAPGGAVAGQPIPRLDDPCEVASLGIQRGDGGWDRRIGSLRSVRDAVLHIAFAFANSPCARPRGPCDLRDDVPSVGAEVDLRRRALARASVSCPMASASASVEGWDPASAVAPWAMERSRFDAADADAPTHADGRHSWPRSIQLRTVCGLSFMRCTISWTVRYSSSS